MVKLGRETGGSLHRGWASASSSLPAGAFLWIGIHPIGKKSILHKLISKIDLSHIPIQLGLYNTVPIKIIAGVFGDTGKEILKFIWKGKAKANLKKNKVGDSRYLTLRCTVRLQ